MHLLQSLDSEYVYMAQALTFCNYPFNEEDSRIWGYKVASAYKGTPENAAQFNPAT